MKKKEHLTDWVSMIEFCQAFPQFKIGTARWWQFHSSVNGFNECTKKIGRKVYISPTLFWIWFNSSTIDHGATVYNTPEENKEK